MARIAVAVAVHALGQAGELRVSDGGFRSAVAGLKKFVRTAESTELFALTARSGILCLYLADQSSNSFFVPR